MNHHTTIFTLYLGTRLIRCVVPVEYDWLKFNPVGVDIETWLGGYRE